MSAPDAGFDPVAAATRADAATPGPWLRDAFTMRDGAETENVHARCWDVAVCTVHGADTPPDEGRADQAAADADFIAHARMDLPAALQALAVVRAENERLARQSREDADALEVYAVARDAAVAENAELRAALDRPVFALIHDQGNFGPFPSRDAAFEYGHSLSVGSRFDESYEAWPLTRPAAVSPDPQPSHCPSCQRPLPHNDTERARCPDLMGPLKASIDAARSRRVSPDPQEQR